MCSGPLSYLYIKQTGGGGAILLFSLAGDLVLVSTCQHAASRTRTPPSPRLPALYFDPRTLFDWNAAHYGRRIRTRHSARRVQHDEERRWEPCPSLGTVPALALRAPSLTKVLPPTVLVRPLDLCAPLKTAGLAGSFACGDRPHPDPHFGPVPRDYVVPGQALGSLRAGPNARSFSARPTRSRRSTSSRARHTPSARGR